MAERQRVEILKVLYRGARILILDEPTAVLVPQEVDALFGNLRELKSEGVTVIFISHKLHEVLSVADAITVIRRGTTVGDADPKKVTARELAELMVGSELPSPQSRESTVTDVEMLKVDALRIAKRDAEGIERVVLDDISLTIRKGEILGIAGVEGNGQAELVEAIMGMLPLDSGTVTLDGTDVSREPPGPAARPASGTSPRTGTGTACCWRPRSGRTGSWATSPRRRTPRASGSTRPPPGRTPCGSSRSTTSAPPASSPAASLSGGNQQKLIIGREMSHKPKLLIAAHPTRGVDVGAQAPIWEHIRPRSARPGRAADLGRPGRADRPVGRHPGDLRGRLVADADPATVTPRTSAPR